MTHVLAADVGATDWIGIAACISALATLVVALKNRQSLNVGNGQSVGKAVAEVKEIVADTQTKVAAAPDPPASS